MYNAKNRKNICWKLCSKFLRSFFSSFLIRACLLTWLFFLPVAEARPSSLSDPQVFILKSTGVCQGCAEAISKMLFTAGIRSQILGPEQLIANVRPQDLLIIGGGVPGGEGEWTIKQDLMKVHAFEWLKKHIENGGRYFGICAGAYLAEQWIDRPNKISGLDIFPGSIDVYTQNKSAQVLRVRFLRERVVRSAYFQDGPAFYPSSASEVEVVARFERDKTPAAVLFSYGKGKVGLLSPHLEADQDWFTEANLNDQDGSDYDLGINMIKKVLQP